MEKKIKNILSILGLTIIYSIFLSTEYFFSDNLSLLILVVPLSLLVALGIYWKFKNMYSMAIGYGIILILIRLLLIIMGR